MSAGRPGAAGRWIFSEISPPERLGLRVLLLLAGPLRFGFSMLGAERPEFDLGLVAYFAYFMLPYGVALVASWRSPRRAPSWLTSIAIVAGELWSLVAVASAPESTQVIAWGLMPLRQLALALLGLALDWGMRRVSRASAA